MGTQWLDDQEQAASVRLAALLELLPGATWWNGFPAPTTPGPPTSD